MARVLVVHPPASIARDFIDYPYFSDLGAVQLAGVLRAAGHSVALVDAYALTGSSLTWRSDGRAHLGASIDHVVASCEGRPWDVAVVALTPFHRPPRRDDLVAALLQALRACAPRASRTLAESGPARERGCLLLADLYQSGQHYVEADGADVLASYPEASAWVKYEGEITVPHLVDRWTHGEPIEGTYRGTDVASLDELALPAWDLVDLPAYDAFHDRVVRGLGRATWAFPIDGRTLPMVSSRGCPFRCSHCSSNPGRAEGAPKVQRRLSVARLRDHIDALVGTHQATRLEVLDELINVNERHFDGFLDVTAELGVAFDVPNGMRADYLDAGHFARMRGRVATVSVSAESGVQRVVTEIVGKQLDLASIERAAAGAHTAGVPLLVHFLIGLPGETAREISETLEFAARLFARYGARPALQFATPLPGTALARGRRLPTVDDWGPRFQQQPTSLGDVGAGELQRFKESFDRWLRQAEEPPAATMNVTYVCNNNCVFCATGPRTGIASHAMGQRGELLRLRRAGVRALAIDGGEPTLHPELLAIIREARAVGFERVGVTTNGRRCFYEDFARRLVASGLTSAAFSVHGADAELHARHVGVPEAFEQTVTGIRHCVKHAPPGVTLAMSTTVTRHNAERLGSIAELAASLGLTGLLLRMVTPFGRGTSAVALDLPAAAGAVRNVLDEHGDRLAIQVLDLPWCALPGYERFLASDPALQAHRTTHTNTGAVHLARYVADQRVRRPVCLSCPHAVSCSGFYDLDEAPDPPWLRSRGPMAPAGSSA
jgi:MoaA/NifB/PqqE/SkfB family radical SAM enzyme